MIKWLFKEWLNLIESYAASPKKKNFEHLYLLLIKGFLDALINFGHTNTKFFKSHQLDELERMNSGSDTLYDMLFSGTGGYTTTVLNDTNFSTAFDNRYEDIVNRYLKDGSDYIFKKFTTFDDYLKFSGSQKSIQFGSAAVILNSAKDLIIFLFLKPLINSYQKKVKGAKEKQIVGDSDTEMSSDNFGTENLVTRRREEESEAMITVAPLFDCIRNLYGKIGSNLKSEIQKDMQGVYSSEPSTVKNLTSLKKKLHKFFTASFISGKEPSKSDTEIGDDNVTDSELAKIIHDEERNVIRLLLLKDKFNEFFRRQSSENPELYNLMIDVCGTLYYISMLNQLNINKQTGKPIGDVPVEEKQKLRREFLSLVPESIKQRFEEDRLKEFSSMRPKSLPQVSYEGSLEELKSKGFENLMPQLSISHSFPVAYIENKTDEYGNTIRNAKVDLINEFLKPIFEILGNKSTIKELQSLDCDEIIAHYKSKGII